MKIIHARISETNSKNGKKGDQTKKEVTISDYYNHKLGWYTLRSYRPELSRLIQKYALLLANNENIGYSQSDRLSLLNELSQNNWDITKIKPCNCDCSSFVRVCIILACIELKLDYSKIYNFTTSNEKYTLLNSGLFYLVTTGSNFNGDILVTKTQGHTVICYDQVSTVITSEKPTKKDIHTIALEVIHGDWGNGANRINRLSKSGYDPVKVQKEVNMILGGTNK